MNKQVQIQDSNAIRDVNSKALTYRRNPRINIERNLRNTVKRLEAEVAQLRADVEWLKKVVVRDEVKI